VPGSSVCSKFHILCADSWRQRKGGLWQGTGKSSPGIFFPPGTHNQDLVHLCVHSEWLPKLVTSRVTGEAFFFFKQNKNI
jgi:hypothetical protein